MSTPFTNRLINESSPYLLQHAHNPVDWYPWGQEALEKAKKENKIILVSIGYAACHWCHVMEKESFENETVAALMNENFINIKIDREERPDLDHIYMDAVQAMTGSGGWPLNVFLTPEAKPFYGGTYFPPVKAHNRPSWTDVLSGIMQGWRTKSEEISQQANTLTEHIKRSNDFGQADTLIPFGDIFSRTQCDTIFQNIMKTADKDWGGFGKAPKFPQTFTIQFLLQYHYFTGNAEALQQALLSIDKMLEGGIYDHVGGGLARYSTDNEWLIPHFEKMLYDNALLLNICCDAYQLTKDPQYEKAIRKTIDFVKREMLDPDAGFYAALDADSEGEEGKYYVWQKMEIEEILGDEAALFCAYFDVTEKGNWNEGGLPVKGTNILRVLKKAKPFADANELEVGDFEKRINQNLGSLLKKRKERARPLTDDKILLGWNALMITALCKASAALADIAYLDLAKTSFNNILSNFQAAQNGVAFCHSFKEDKARFPAFLDDYAYLIQSCIQLQEITSETGYLLRAEELTQHVIENFIDEENGYFFFTNKYQDDVIVRKKEVYDGAVPSGNSVMAENLFYLSKIFDKPGWQQIAANSTVKLSTAIIRYPTSFAIWASVILKQTYGVNEIVITGNNYQMIRDSFLQQYRPDKIVQCAASADNRFPLLTGKSYGGETWIYKCKNYACGVPVRSLEELFLEPIIRP
jgi:uncharacterized protein YyaL (SSP411 family)